MLLCQTVFSISPAVLLTSNVNFILPFGPTVQLYVLDLVAVNINKFISIIHKQIHEYEVICVDRP